MMHESTEMAASVLLKVPKGHGIACDELGQ